jgi:hypothetical protein
LVRLKFASGANDQIQLGTVFGGSAKVATSVALPGGLPADGVDPPP